MLTKAERLTILGIEHLVMIIGPNTLRSRVSKCLRLQIDDAHSSRVS